MHSMKTDFTQQAPSSQSDTIYVKPAIVWDNIIFFIVTTLFGVIGAPIYIYHYGITGSEIALFVFYLIVTGMSITVGYHRLFAHCSFKASPIVQFFVLFFGAAAFEQSAFRWASQHRDHHRFVDTDRDPYNIKKGFFYAHIGWLMFWKHKTNYENCPDLQKNRMVMNQYNFYYLWAPIAGIITPLVIGALTGHILGAFLLSVCARITLVYHSTFCINSVCHMFGNSPYDAHSTAKDNWLTALVTYGEGYHNFHHRFPSDYRNAVLWYQFDPSKWMISALSWVGLTSELKRVSKFRIMEARLVTQNQRTNEWLKTKSNLPNLAVLRENLNNQYEKLRQTLVDWEHAVKEYQALVCQQISRHSEDLRTSAMQKMMEARERFQETRESWNNFRFQTLGMGV